MNDEKPAFQPCSMREGESFQLFSPVRNQHTRSLIGLDDTASRCTSIASTRGEVDLHTGDHRVQQPGEPPRTTGLGQVPCEDQRTIGAMLRSPVRIAVVGAAIVVLAFVLNPSAEKHRNRIKESFADRSPIAGVLGIGALAAFASTYHPVGVASYTTVDGKMLSIGAFGVVLVLQPSRDK